jgi:PhzF family phenazine biosynthesis protein
MLRGFKLVDVFGDSPFQGNPVAVCLDGRTLSVAAMQQIASWNNLSETTFLLPPTTAGADYKVRIFTPRSELPFAGHPTLGSAHAALEAGLVTATNGRVMQESAGGLVEVRLSHRGSQRLCSLKMPPATSTEVTNEAIEELERAVGPLCRNPRPKVIDVGPKWVVAQVPGTLSVRDIRPDLDRVMAIDRGLGSTGVTVFGLLPHGERYQMEVRTFAPSEGVNEDPVCGSSNGAVSAFLREAGFGAYRSYVANQGTAVGRSGSIHLETGPDDSTWVGGTCATLVNGTLLAS